MKRLLTLIILLMLQGCVTGYTKLELGTIRSLNVESFSLLAARLNVSVEVDNRSNKDLRVDGLEVTIENLEGVALNMSSPVVIGSGSSVVDIPLDFSYNPLFALSIPDLLKQGVVANIKLTTPYGKINLKKEINSQQLSSFLKQFEK